MSAAIELMPTRYQQDRLQVVLSLFLLATGKPLPQYATVKSPSSLSRFFNHYHWPTRRLIRLIRQHIVTYLLAARPRGRRLHLQAIIDLTSLEKRGKFSLLGPLIRVFHRKRGLHIVMLYLVVGPWRLPWNFRVYRGKDTATPVQLALTLLCSFPSSLTTHYRVTILADCAFGSSVFLCRAELWSLA